MVTHIDRFCRNAIATGGEEGEKEWGSWLRAPPRRVAGQNQSRWLRDENDDTWEARIGGSSNNQQFSGGNFSKKGKEINEESNLRDLVGRDTRLGVITTNPIFSAKNQGFTTIQNAVFGRNEDESIGLQLEECKRRRSEKEVGLSDIEMGHVTAGPLTDGKNEGTDISEMDLSAPSKNVLAELAMQASRQK